MKTTPKQLPLFAPTTLLDQVAANEADAKMSSFTARNRANNFYRSKAWRRARIAVLARDGPRCCACGSTRQEVTRLDVDHKVPLSVAPHLGLYLPNLQVLCDDCHTGKSYRDGIGLRTRTDADDSKAA
jgi:5-methylcytosine-specific restriction endonuclease McrA